MTTETTLDACMPSHGHAMGQDIAEKVVAALKSLADPLRLRMLSIIASDPRGEACVCDLAGLSDVSQPTVSHHLRVLKDAELLVSERRGTWVWYRIAPGRHHAIAALLDTFAPATITNNPLPAPQANDDMQITELAEQLAEEYSGLSRDLVFTVVRESHIALLRSASSIRHILSRCEQFARQRLADTTRDRTDDVVQVLFVCVHNAGRSQLAAALANELGGGTVRARSAGSSPAAEVHPQVQSLLAEIGEPLAASTAFPKPLTDDAVRAADVVVTMGCGDICPTLPGIRYEDWAIGDPALASPEGIVAIRTDIENRVRSLLATITPQESTS